MIAAASPLTDPRRQLSCRPEEGRAQSRSDRRFRNSFDVAKARGLHALYELRIDDASLHLRADDGELRTTTSPPETPDARLIMDAGTYLAWRRGQITTADAVKQGRLQLEGEHELIDRFAEAFSIHGHPTARGSEPAPAGS